MTSKRDTPTTRPTDARDQAVDEDLEAAIDGAVAQIAPDGLGDATDRAIVASVIDDASSGALTSRARAVRRARRATVPSVVPSMLAKSMRHPPSGAARSAPVNKLARDPAAPVDPVAQSADVTRRALDADVTGRESSDYSIEMLADEMLEDEAGDASSAATAEQLVPTLGPVATLVLKACSSLDSGDIAEAVIAAAAALTAVGTSPEKDFGDLTDTAAGPLARIFYEGPINKVPVVNRADAELDNLPLDELHWAFLRRLDGKTTLRDAFRATKIPPLDSLKVAASLLREGVVRIEDRARS